MKSIQINITFEKTFVQITNEGGKAELMIKTSGIYSPDETGITQVIAEAAKCFVLGYEIDRHFNPTKSVSSMLKLVKCEWLDSGNLKLRSTEVTKHYAHANTVEEALLRKGVFTTLQEIYDNLPKRREKLYVSDKQIPMSEINIDQSCNIRNPANSVKK